VIGAGRLPVEEHPEPRRRSRRGRSHDQVKVARLEPAGDPPVGRVEPGASSWIVQSPARAQWLSLSSAGGV
jgi:hypothetical protein